MAVGLPALAACLWPTALLAQASGSVPTTQAAALCPEHLRPAAVPPTLVSGVAKAFGVPDEAARNGYVRCVGPRLLACIVGANLNCGKADVRRALPGATAWCRENPDADFIPMYATGHATIYAWRCAGRRAVADKTIATVDAQGYMAENWREVR